MAIDNKSNQNPINGNVSKEDVQKKKEILKKSVKEDIMRYVYILKEGKERVMTYANSYKEEMLNKAAVDYEFEKSIIEKEYKEKIEAVSKSDLSNDITKILNDLNSLIELPKEQQEKIKESLTIGQDNILKKKIEDIEKEKKEKLNEIENRYNAAKEEAEQRYQKLIDYVNIINQRIKQREKEIENSFANIDCADELILESMWANRKGIDRNSNFQSSYNKRDLGNLKTIALTVIIGGSLALTMSKLSLYQRIQENKVQDAKSNVVTKTKQQNEDETNRFYIFKNKDEQPFKEIYEFKIPLSTESFNQIPFSPLLPSKINTTPVIPTKQEIKPAASKQQKKTPSNVKKQKKENINDKLAILNKRIVSLRNAAEFVSSDGNIFFTSTGTRYKKVIKLVEKKIKDGKINEKDISRISSIFAYIEKCILLYRDSKDQRVYVPLMSEIRGMSFDLLEAMKKEKIDSKEMKEFNVQVQKIYEKYVNLYKTHEKK